MTGIETGVGEQLALGVPLDIDAVAVGCIADQGGPSGGLIEYAGRNRVVMEDPGHLGVLLAAGVEHLVRRGVTPLAVQRVEQVYPVVEHPDGTHTQAAGSAGRHRIDWQRPVDRLGGDGIGILVVGMGGIGRLDRKDAGVVVDRQSLPVMTRWAPETVMENRAWGHATEPPTATLVRESQVLSAVLIHGPTTEAPPCVGKLVTQESTEPTFGDVDTYPSPSGMAAGLIGPRERDRRGVANALRLRMGR